MREGHGSRAHELWGDMTSGPGSVELCLPGKLPILSNLRVFFRGDERKRFHGVVVKVSYVTSWSQCSTNNTASPKPDASLALGLYLGT